MALRLKGSSSGYAEIDASENAGSVTLTLPATTGTINVKDASGTTNVGTGVDLGNPGANIFTISNTGGERLRIAADGSVSIPGNLNISGVLTYEDVTSVDAIGLSTFREGLNTKDVGITTISSSISDTAVDIFIYDTSKDSDGGEWRKRTKHTSWYNEPLNTSIRGSRREFPSVAVIVTEATKVTIYDGDDPDLPMWMVFTWVGTSPLSALGYNNRVKSATTMINGQLVTCGDPDGLHIARFIHDDVIRYTHTALYKTTDVISKRTNSWNPPTISTTDVLIASTCNDVAVTVLPNAPIDEISGLPIPTIAVATDSGISVVRDNGDVVDMTQNDANERPVLQIGFTKSNKLIFRHNYNWIYYYEIPSSDLNAAYWNVLSGFIGRFTSVERTWANGSGTALSINTPSNIDEFLEDKAMGHTNGVNILAFNEEAIGYGMHAGIATNFNTGYQHGDIKGAFLSDTDTTNLTGAQAVTNGTFNSDVSGWTTDTSTITYNSNNANIARNSGPASSGIYQEITLVPGKTYSVSMDVSAVNGGTFVSLYLISDNGAGTSQEYRTAAAGTPNNIIGSYTALTASTRIAINATGNSSGTATIDNISVRLAEQDRSYNGPYQSRDDGTGAALGIYGTITKTAVATGADLVAYSGFSGSNYLAQPNNSDLAPGTGQYSVSCWFKTTSSSSNDQYIFDRGVGGSNSRNLMLIMQTSGRIQFYHTNSSGTASDLQTTDMPSFADNNWHHVVGLYDGSVYKVYVDGNASSITNTTGRDVGNDGSPELTIGARFNATQTFGGSLALFRYSRSAPTPEQVKKMYDDEKHFFQENAKATLYGSSDAVTALAHDELTDQLHVGTSSGRSDFQGLRRINNTTTAVTTAISAHDTFIIEQ